MDCYELTIITIKDLIGKADGIDGYTLMKYLSGKFESIESQLFSVDAEQVIIHAPEQYGVGIDYDTRRLEDVHVCHYNATRKDN